MFRRNWGPVYDFSLEFKMCILVELWAQLLYSQAGIFGRQSDTFYVNVLAIILLTAQKAVLDEKTSAGLVFPVCWGHTWIVKVRIFGTESSVIFKENIKNDFFVVPMVFLKHCLKINNRNVVVKWYVSLQKSRRSRSKRRLKSLRFSSLNPSHHDVQKFRENQLWCAEKSLALSMKGWWCHQI